jgi:hypothetical protein
MGLVMAFCGVFCGVFTGSVASITEGKRSSGWGVALDCAVSQLDLELRELLVGSGEGCRR